MRRMDKRKRKFSMPFTMKVVVEMFLSGIFMIVAGGAYKSTQLHDSPTGKIILLMAFIIVIGIRLSINLINSLDGDEMSESHYKDALVSRYKRILISILVCGAIGVVISFKGMEFVSDWYCWGLVLIGVNDIFSGIHFYLLERGSVI